MKVPPSSAGSEGRSHQLLRVQSVGLTAAVAAVASCMLVAVALAGFAPGGIRAGQARSVLEVPGPIQVLAPSTSAVPPSAQASTATPSTTPSAGPTRPEGAVAAAKTGPATVPVRPQPQTTVSATKSNAPATRPRKPRDSGRPRNVPPEPERPQFDSPFEYQDVRQAQEAITTEVRRTLQNIPLAAKPNYSGLLQFSAQVSLASLSRKTSSQQVQTEAALDALRGVTNNPIRQAMVQSASTAFDAALSAQKSGASPVELEQTLRRTFRRNLSQGFTQVVLPVVQRTVAGVIPQVQGTPAMYIAVQTASMTISDRNCPEVVDDLAQQLEHTATASPRDGPAKAPDGQIGIWPENPPPTFNFSSPPVSPPAPGQPGVAPTPSLDPSLPPVSPPAPGRPGVTPTPTGSPRSPEAGQSVPPTETTSAEPTLVAPSEAPISGSPAADCGPTPAPVTGLDLVPACPLSSSMATP